MASERRRLGQKYNAIATQYNLHLKKFNEAAGKETQYNLARSALNDMIDFHNEACKIAEKCLERTGRDISTHEKNYRSAHSAFMNWVPHYNLENREIL